MNRVVKIRAMTVDSTEARERDRQDVKRIKIRHDNKSRACVPLANIFWSYGLV